MRRLPHGLPPSFARLVVGVGDPALCRADDSMARRLGVGVVLRPRGPRSGPGYSVPILLRLSTPSAPLAGTSQFRRPATYMRCLRCAGAPRRPASGSELSLSIPSRHAAPYVPGEIGTVFIQFFQFRHWPLPRSERLGSLVYPAIRFKQGTYFGAYWFAFATACQVARPSGRI